MNYIFGNDLKQNIKQRLKIFSQLKTKYGIDAVYRTGEVEYFSQTAKRFRIEGLPKSRPTAALTENDEDNTEKDEDILEPIWYSTAIENSIIYCNRYAATTSKCETYKYIPYDNSLVKSKKLLFLDLTNIMVYKAQRDDGKTQQIYNLNEEFMRQIYDNILEKWADQFFYDDDDKSENLCVDNPCMNTFTIDEIRSAYGYFNGIRNSEGSIDKFFTIELFRIIKELEIEKELDCIFMGYFHAHVDSGGFEEDMMKEGGVQFPAEFAIPYKCAINKNYMSFEGVKAKDGVILKEDDSNGLDKKRKFGSGRRKTIKTKTKNKKRTKIVRYGGNNKKIKRTKRRQNKK